MGGGVQYIMYLLVKMKCLHQRNFFPFSFFKERETARIPSRLPEILAKPNVGLMTWAEIKSPWLNRVSHPGAHP